MSLDALSRGVYEAQRTGARYDQVMANVAAFLVARKRAGGLLPEVQVSAVETATTRGEIPAFMDYWSRHVDRVRIYPEHSQGGVFGALPEALGPRKPCGKPLTDLVIYCDGGVALCNQDWERKEPLGNVRTQSIAEVWRSAAYDRIRRLHREGRAEEDPTCRGCGHWAQYYREGGILGRLVAGSQSGDSGNL